MIPKVIHYCWFGQKQKPKLILDCIDSWRKLCPDYDIIEWNETNSDMSNNFVKNAYATKKWAFVADYIRLDVLSKHGGIYLDTDMMLLKSLDELLFNKCFFGAEEEKIISGGIIGCVKGDPFIEKCASNYSGLNIDSDTDFNSIAIPLVLTDTLEKQYGIKVSIENNTVIDNIKIYTKEYFYPFPNKNKSDIKNYLNYKTEKTIAIHLWNASWVTYNEFDYIKKKKYFKALVQILNTIFIKRKFNLYYFKRLFNNTFKK